MKTILLTIVCLFYDKTVNADKVKVRSSKIVRRSSAKAANINVVNHEICFSCLSEEEKEWKANLEDVHLDVPKKTFFLLKNKLAEPVTHQPWG